MTYIKYRADGRKVAISPGEWCGFEELARRTGLRNGEVLQWVEWCHREQCVYELFCHIDCLVLFVDGVKSRVVRFDCVD